MAVAVAGSHRGKRSLQAEVIPVRRAATMRGSNTDGVPRFALP